MPPDIAPEPLGRAGEGIEPRQATRVEMESEVVRIVLRPDEARVHARFVLRNPGPAERLEIGFPAGTSWSRDHDAVDLREFEARVDGTPAVAVVQQEKRPDDPSAEPATKAPYRQWLCWMQDLAADSRVAVDVSYAVDTRDDPHTKHTPFRARRFSYILKTGAGWRGAIGSARIILEFDGVDPRAVRKATPDPRARTPHAWTWDFADLKPDFDIEIEYQVFADAADARSKVAATRDPNDLLDLAECLELEGHFGAAAEVYGELEAREKWPDGPVEGTWEDLDWVVPDWIACRPTTSYVPTSLLAARCLMRCGRIDEARARARAAIRQIRLIPSVVSPRAIGRALRMSGEEWRLIQAEAEILAEGRIPTPAELAPEPAPPPPPPQRVELSFRSPIERGQWPGLLRSVPSFEWTEAEGAVRGVTREGFVARFLEGNPHKVAIEVDGPEGATQAFVRFLKWAALPRLQATEVQELGPGASPASPKEEGALRELMDRTDAMADVCRIALEGADWDVDEAEQAVEMIERQEDRKLSPEDLRREKERRRSGAAKKGEAKAVAAIAGGTFEILTTGLVRSPRELCVKCGRQYRRREGALGWLARLGQCWCFARRVRLGSVGCCECPRSSGFVAAYNARVIEHIRAKFNPRFELK